MINDRIRLVTALKKTSTILPYYSLLLFYDWNIIAQENATFCGKSFDSDDSKKLQIYKVRKISLFEERTFIILILSLYWLLQVMKMVDPENNNF